MKFKLLILTCALLSISKTDAAQKGEQGGVIAQHSPGQVRNLHDTPYMAQELPNSSRNSGSKEVTSTTTDPFELADLSNDYFGKGDYKKAASLFISSVIHGNTDNKAAIAEIDVGSLKYLDSNQAQSAEANVYYEIHLTPKLIEYFKAQAAELKKHKDMPVKLYNAH